MAYSKQRESILRTDQSSRIHPTADEIYAALKPQQPGLSLGTVYRNLNLLTDSGKIRKVTLSGCADRFDGTMAPHCHLQCRTCGRVVDMPEMEFLDKLMQTAPPADCEIEAVNLLFYGKCAACVKKRHDDDIQNGNRSIVKTKGD